jgi:CubicO group peptidase (beta-lactamase class C family)
MMTRLMQGFPPTPDQQVTLANWRTSPFNRWAFHHVREIVPSADIPCDPARTADFPSNPIDLSPLRIDTGRGTAQPFAEFLGETGTDGLVIVTRGRIAFEAYANGMTAESPHILMSVSKSLLGLLAGIVAARGSLEPERPVTAYVPEVAGTAYRGATVRQLLDMRAGIAFDEDYLASSGAIIAYRKAAGWNPLDPGDEPSDLRSFYRQLTDAAGPHGGPFTYVSPNTDLLGWAIERATGCRYADLVSDLIWKPMGAWRSAYITVDRLGAPRCAGGVCATVRDLARVGQLIVEGGVRGGTQVIPASWIDDMVAGGDAAAWASGNGADYFPGVPMRYRSQWYVRDGAPPLLFGLGIHGQNLFIDRRNELVIAKVSSQAIPMDHERITHTMRGMAALRQFLTP